MKTASALAFFIFSSSSFGFNIRVPMDLGDCNCKSSNFEVLKAVGDASKDHFSNEDLLEDVAIRGEDDRRFSKDLNAAMPFGCNYDGADRVFATAALVAGNKIATVLHNIVNYQPECKELSDLSKCFIYDGQKKIKVASWTTDPIDLCKGSQKDQIITGELESIVKDRKPFVAACIDFINSSKIDKVITVGARASNFSRPKLGLEAIASSGIFYGISREGGMLKFENDLGAGTSGGAVLAEINGKQYLIGIIRGDSYKGDYRDRFEKGMPMDGLPADKDANFGQAFPIFSESSIPCEKTANHSS